MKKLIEISELQTQLDSLVSEYVDLISSLNEDEFNNTPHKENWTPAQIVCHIEKSIHGMPELMAKEFKLADRDPDQHIEELKNTLLDFSKKMKSPEFILPENKKYDKKKSITELTQSAKGFKESIEETNLAQLVENLPFGSSTKLEIIYFSLYHMERHLHQLKNTLK